MEGIFSLTAYSILAQAGAGMAVLLFVARSVIGVDEANRKKYVQGYTAAAIITAAGLLISMTDLGMPLRAPNAILNLGTSWLSREIFFNGAFFACAAVTAFLLGKGKGGAALFAALAALSGILCIYSQAAVYANTVMPAWGFGHAYVTFFGAMLAMGCGLTGILFYGKEDAGSRKFFILGGTVLLLCIAAQGAAYSYLAGGLAGAGAAGMKSLLLLESKGALAAAGILCLAAGLLLGVCQFHRGELGTGLYLAAALIVAGEVMNRMVFYGIGVPIGL